MIDKSKYREKYNNKHRLLNSNPDNLDLNKKCNMCLIVKEARFFNKAKCFRGGLSSYCKDCFRKIVRTELAYLRGLVFDKLGDKCLRCDFSDKRALQIDHVNGGGNRDRRSKSSRRFLKNVLQDESGLYQILCANCNWIKRATLQEASR